MHHGKIDHDTAARRVYLYLLERAGEWCDGWEMAIATRTNALSTRVSEVRRQLPARWALEHSQTVVDGKRKQYYRLVLVQAGEQMEIAV